MTGVQTCALPIYSEALLEQEKYSLKDFAMLFQSSLMSTIPAPFDTNVEKPSILKVHVESANPANSASLTSLGTSSEIVELSSPGNRAKRSAMA